MRLFRFRGFCISYASDLGGSFPQREPPGATNGPKRAPQKACLQFAIPVLVLAASVCAGLPALAQGAVVSPPEAAAVSWPSVGLNVLLVSKTNATEPVPDLAKIQILEDGAPQAISSVLGPRAPISLCFAIDDSGSTEELKQSIPLSVKAIAESLTPGSEIAAVHFADQAYLDLPFTLAHNVDAKLLSLASHRGGTALYDALVATEDYCLRHAQYRRRAIVVVTDGQDNASRLNLEQAIERMRNPSAPLLYALFLPDRDMSWIVLRHSQRALELLTDSGGGLVFRPAHPKGVRPSDAAVDAANRLADAIRQQSVVTYTAGNRLRDTKPRQVGLTLPPASFEVRYRHEYASASKPLP